MDDKKDVRVHKRIPYEAIINNAQAIDFGEKFDLLAYDLSKGGIGVTAQRDISIGTFLNFDIDLENIRYTVMGIVKWKLGNNSAYRYGIEFIGIANMFYRHIHLITNKKSFFDQSFTGAVEKRRHERYNIIQEVLCNEIYCESSRGREQLKGINFQICDLSFKGAGVNCSEKLTVDSFISFQFFSQQKISSFKGKVIWSKYNLNGSIGMRYKAGIEFVNLKVDDLHTLHSIFSSNGYYI